MREGDEKQMTVEFSELHKILKDPTRKDILKCLNEKAPLTYVELMDLAKVTNTGRFNYHLKILGELIEKQADGRYGLTDRGRLAVRLIDEFPEKTLQIDRKKNKKKKLAIVAVILFAGIIAISAMLISIQLSQYNFNVTYWKQQPDPLYSYDIQYVFNITGTHETFQLATSNAINNALAPYVNKYPFAPITIGNRTIIPFWTSTYVGKGQFTLGLTLKSSLSDAQVKSLTHDLKVALKSTQ